MEVKLYQNSEETINAENDKGARIIVHSLLFINTGARNIRSEKENIKRK